MIHHFPLKVYYEDTDFSGVVYHASYLRFAERGRSEFLAECAISHNVLLARDPPLAFVVFRMEIDFLIPARVEDRLVVETKLTETKGVQFVMEQEIKRGEELIWRASVRAAIINPQTARPSRAAADIMAKLTKTIDIGN